MTAIERAEQHQRRCGQRGEAPLELGVAVRAAQPRHEGALARLHLRRWQDERPEALRVRVEAARHLLRRAGRGLSAFRTDGRRRLQDQGAHALGLVDRHPERGPGAERGAHQVEGVQAQRARGLRHGRGQRRDARRARVLRGVPEAGHLEREHAEAAGQEVVARGDPEPTGPVEVDHGGPVARLHVTDPEAVRLDVALAELRADRHGPRPSRASRSSRSDVADARQDLLAEEVQRAHEEVQRCRSRAAAGRDRARPRPPRRGSGAPAPPRCPGSR